MEITILVGVAFVILIAVVAYYQKKQEEARTAALISFAQSYGLQIAAGGLNDTLPGGFWANFMGDRSSTDEARFLSRFAGFYPFGTGHSPSVENVIYGRRGELDWAIFDYSYKVTTSNGKSSSTTTHWFSIVCCRVGVLLPNVTMEPETVLHRIGSKLGMRELNFESEEFNRRYFVRCPEEREAYDLLHPRAISYLLDCAPRRWECRGFQLVIAQPGRIQATEYEQIMREIEGFIKLLPGYLKEDRAVEAHFEGPF